MKEYFDVSGKKVILPSCADEKVFGELVSAFAPVNAPSVTAKSGENTFVIGECGKIEPTEGEFAVNVTKNGVCVAGKDYPSAVRGFISFLETLKPTENGGSYRAECGTYFGRPKVGFRCLHLCLFPETDLNDIIKRVKLAALTLYTHVIIEFWGTLEFDCMKELSWAEAYKKEQIRPIIDTANALGLEVIPMFNHLGHAAAASESIGKHVVLDQNPEFEYMFTDYGWEWKIDNPDVIALHKSVRRELIELCGKGGYFHIGCDEAYTVGGDVTRAKACAEYINSVARELKKEGRRVIVWGDMLLSKTRYKVEPPEFYCANSDEEIARIFTETLDKSIVIADWQYDVKKRVWSTTEDLIKAGFDVVCCPWYDRGNIVSAVDTAEKTNAFGVMCTTWHSEKLSYAGTVLTGELCYGGEKEGVLHHRAAELTRKALPANGDYRAAGFIKKFPMIG